MNGSEPRETGWTDDLPRRRGARVATIVMGAGLAVATAGFILNPRQSAPKQVVPDPVLFGVAVALILLAGARFAIRRKRRGKPSWIEQDRSERALATDNGLGLLLIVLVALQLFRSFPAGPDEASFTSWWMPVAAVMFGLAVSYEALRDAHGMPAAPFRFARAGSSDATRAGFAVLLVAACIVATLDTMRPGFLSPVAALALVGLSGIAARQCRLAILLRRAMRAPDPARRSPVREARIARGLTQAMLAERIDATRLTINAVENGLLVPSLALAAALAEALGTTADALSDAAPQRTGSAGTSAMS